GKAISGGPTVETRLPPNIDTVAVALELVDDSACAEELLDGLVLTIDGAQQTTDEPIRAAVGNRIMLLFPVEPKHGTDHVSVTVGTDGHWHPAGVIGAAMSAAAVVDALRETDLSALIGTVVRAGIGESELRFRAPGRRRPQVEDTAAMALSRPAKTPVWSANASRRLSGQRRSQARGGNK
ncbi:MAG: hypothetical protein U9N84_10015, partial [Actinomycetota bacterium]|nr:hypothetical protein [Actinomycetota bacterium]